VTLEAAVLAGGRSSRMGRDKASLPIEGVSLLERTVAVARADGLRTMVVGRGRPAGWSDPATRFLPDSLPGTGPLPAIAQALASSGHDLLVLACDLPRLEVVALRWLRSAAAEHPTARAVVGEVGGRVQPLFAVWRRTCLPGLSLAQRSGARSPARWLTAAGAAVVAIPGIIARMLVDCDTPEEWRRFGAAGVPVIDAYAP
jgi:molybdopterin-guanine dinucleotide biosynthesis protein A